MAERLLELLERVVVPFSARKNVAAAPVRSVTVGLVVRRDGRVGISGATLLHRGALARRLLALLADASLRGEPPGAFTSVCLNVDYAAKLHVDARNEGRSAVLGLGAYEGGALWTADEEGDVAVLAEDDSVPGLRQGAFLLGHRLDVQGRWTYIDGAAPHFVEPFRGRRVSAVFFTVPDASQRQLAVLRALGFPSPQHVPSSLTELSPYTVCVCSSRRAGGLADATLALLRREGIHPRDVQVRLRDAEDAEAYDYLSSAGVRVLMSPSPSLGLPAQRAAFLRDAAPGAWLLFLDDDVEEVRGLPPPDGPRSSLHEVAMQGFLEAERAGVHLWGINCSSDPRNLSQSVSDRPGLVCGYFFGVIAAQSLPELLYSDSVGGAAEDIERSARFYRHSGLRRLMFAQAVAKTWSNAGGLQSFFGTREIRSAAHEYVVRKLEREFPELLCYDAERPLRCRFLPARAAPRRDASSDEGGEGLPATPSGEAPIGDEGGEARLAERAQRRAGRGRRAGQTAAHVCPTCLRVFLRKKDLLPHISLRRCFSVRGRHKPVYAPRS